MSERPIDTLSAELDATSREIRQLEERLAGTAVRVPVAVPIAPGEAVAWDSKGQRKRWRVLYCGEERVCPLIEAPAPARLRARPALIKLLQAVDAEAAKMLGEAASVPSTVPSDERAERQTVPNAVTTEQGAGEPTACSRDLSAVVTVSERSAAEVDHLIEKQPGPNPAMRKLFADVPDSITIRTVSAQITVADGETTVTLTMEDIDDALEAVGMVAVSAVPGPEAGKSRTAAQSFRPPWLVVIKKETYPPEATPFDSEDEALAFAAEWGAQWTETYVCKVVRGPLT